MQITRCAVGAQTLGSAGEQDRHLVKPSPPSRCLRQRLPDLESGQAELLHNAVTTRLQGRNPPPSSCVGVRPAVESGSPNLSSSGNRRRSRHAAASNAGCLPMRSAAVRRREPPSPPSAGASSVAPGSASSSEPIVGERKGTPYRLTQSTARRSLAGAGFEPAKAEPQRLQRCPFDRSGTPPEAAESSVGARANQRGLARARRRHAGAVPPAAPRAS